MRIWISIITNGLLSSFLLAVGGYAWTISPSVIRTTTTTMNQRWSSSKPLFVTLDGTDIRGPITPLGNFVLVKTKESLSASEGGILLPDQAKERATEGQVLAAGPGKLHPHTGVRIINPVKPGDSVVFGKFDGVQLVYNDDTCQMIRDDDVMLIYEGSNLMTLNNVRPCRDYVLIEMDIKSAGETTSGIVLAAAVLRDQVPCEGTVIKVGEGRMTSTGEFANPPVSIGDRVKFKDYGGNDVLISGKPYSVVRMVDILCTIVD